MKLGAAIEFMMKNHESLIDNKGYIWCYDGEGRFWRQSRRGYPQEPTNICMPEFLNYTFTREKAKPKCPRQRKST